MLIVTSLCGGKIFIILEGSEKLLQLVSNYSMVSNLKDNEFEVWNQGFFMSPIGAGTIYFLMYLVGLQFMAI
ncbi:hypothetical protein V6Z11_D08G119300 [Gossypium hirsutum]